MNNLNNSFNTRSLGCVESIHYILNSYTHILRNVVVGIEFDNNTNSDYIVKFLESAHKKFASLHSKIVENENIPHFISDVAFSDIPLEIINHNSNKSNVLVKEFEHEMNKLIDVQKYVWRAKLLLAADKNLLILTFHHSIFDGKSIHKLLKHLEGMDKTPNIIPSNIPPPIEKNAMIFESTQEKSEGIRIKDILDKWPIYESCSLDLQKSKCKQIDIDFIKVDLLKKYCKKNQISVNHLLNALTIKAISAMTLDETEIVTHTPVDLTQYDREQIYQDEIGCYITVIHSIVKASKDKSILEIARLYASEFKNNFDKTIIEEEFSFNSLKEFLTNKYKNITTSFQGGVAVSNIGMIELNDRCVQTRVKNISFSTSLFGGLGIFVISALAYKNTLKLLLSYTSPLLSEDYITSYINTFRTLCQHLAEELA